MLPYQERVVAERRQLNEKIARLEAFVDSDAYPRLSETEQDLLKQQLAAMRQYRYILALRVALWLGE